MTTAIEYALMAGHAYRTTRAELNWIPAPQGWTPFFPVPDPTTPTFPVTAGFEAISFTNGTEIVISYAGTYDKDYLGDMLADAGLATGLGSAQLIQAAEYYLQVRALNPSATITLTGHSLGGGLAALIGVFFGVQATTFDQAPFAKSAELNLLTPDVASHLKSDLLAKGYSGADLSGLTNFLQLRQANGGIPNSSLVTNIDVQGEFLSGVPWNIPDRIGTTITDISNSANGVSGFDLHAQSLLTAFLQSNQSAASGSNPQQTLSEVTKKLTDLLKLIFDKKLFAHDTDPNTTEENFLERLVKHEAGVQGSFIADAMDTRFTKDLWKLAQDGGLTLRDGNPGNADLNEVSKTLMAFAMQKYYEETTASPGYNKELFTTENVTNGIRFDMADVSDKFATAATNNEKLNLTEAKGFDLYFKNYLGSTNNFTPEERSLITSLLPYLRDWYVQAGASGLTAADTLNRGAFMLGGNGADQMTGGTAADLLVGNAGADALQGGLGNDTLLGGTGNDNLNGGDGADLLLGGTDNDTLDGGTGNDILKGGEGTDTYAFTGSYGIDIVTDSDGSGTIKVDGQTINTATQKFESIYKNDTSGTTFIKLNDGNSLILLKENDPNRILVNDWSEARNLGISLQGDIPTAPAATLTGDFKKAIDGHNTPDTTDDSYVMTDGNYTPDPSAPDGEANAPDLITGTGGNDVIDNFSANDNCWRIAA